MTSQIDHLGKGSPVLRVSTHIYASCQEDRLENDHFSSKCRHVTPQIDCLVKNEPSSEGFNTEFWGFQGDR